MSSDVVYSPLCVFHKALVITDINENYTMGLVTFFYEELMKLT